MNRDPGRRRARRHGRQPRLQITVATSESTSMAHVIDNANRRSSPNAGRHAPARGEIHPRRQGGLGLLGSRRHRLGDRQSNWKIKKKIGFAVAGVRPEIFSRSASSSPRTANTSSSRLAPPIGSPSSIPRPTRSRTTSWSASGPGISSSPPTRRSSMSPTGSPTM